MISNNTLMRPPLHTALAGAKYADITSRVGFYILIAMACMSPWGNVLRLGERGGQGPTTFLAIALVGLCLLSGKAVRAIVSCPRTLFYAAYVLLGFGPTVQHNAVLAALRLTALGAVYWLLAISVMSLQLREDRARLILRVFAVASAAMLAVALIDYFHIVNVPHFNEGYIGFRVHKGLSGRSLTGPFGNRTALGAHLALALPIPFLELALAKTKSPLHIAVWSIVLAVLSLAALVCYSRAIYVTVLITFVYTMYMTRGTKILRLMILVVPLCLLLAMIGARWFPKQVQILTYRVGTLRANRIGKEAEVRTHALKQTVSDIFRHPMGMGHGFVEFRGRALSVHSMVTEHLRAAGILGFACVVVFVWPLLRAVADRGASPAEGVTCGALLGSLAYGLTHSTQNTLLLWVTVGLLYAMVVHPERLRSAYYVIARRGPDTGTPGQL